MAGFVVKRNSTKEADEVETAIRNNQGYCCCAIVKDETTKCICKDFSEKLDDPNFYGDCNCGLYRKERA